MRSLFSGVSGLKNHQTRMDVIGNNISNVNTAGFKASRVTFQDMLNQTITGAAAAQGNRGGTNAKQIGLGMGVASIDTLFTDGSVQSTGKNTDLCISGNGFFVLGDGSNQYYTRSGAFEFDAAGNYCVPGSGLKVQGWMADANGVINSNAGVTDIVVPVGKTMAATATTKGTYTKNLDAKASSGTTTTAGLTQAQAISNLKLTSGSADYNAVTGLTAVGSVTLSDGKTIVSYDGTTYTTKVTETVDTTTPSLTLAKVISDLSIASGSPDETAINGLASAATTVTLSSGAVVDYAGATGKYTINRTFTTAPLAISGLGITNTADQGLINGLTAGNSVSLSDGTTVTLNAAGTSYTTTQTNLTQAQVNSSLGLVSGVSDYNSVAGLNTVTLADGTTKVSYNGTTYTTTTSKISPATAVASFVVYDSEGVKHTVTGTFKKSTTANEWTFSVGGTTDTGCPITGGTGTITFDSSGKFSGSTVSAISFSPSAAGLGGATSTVSLDFSGMTQFEGETTVAVDKDGNAAGSLTGVSTDASGTIVGSFSNGLKMNLAQVALATFNNPAGLTKSGTNLYSQSNNSGDVRINTANSGGAGTLTPSSLEMSNVDLSEEFSNMIVTQRGFQANSKIITVSDEMIETLVNLKR